MSDACEVTYVQECSNYIPSKSPAAIITRSWVVCRNTTREKYTRVVRSVPVGSTPDGAQDIPYLARNTATVTQLAGFIGR